MMSDSPQNVLAIDTATRRLNLALWYQGDRSVQSSEVVPKTHGQVLIKKIDDLFQSAGLTIDDLQAIVISLGPGSFTGLRIGLAAAKGIAVARDIAIVGVTIFEVAEARLRGENTPAWVTIPSRKNEFYVGIFRDGGIRESDVLLLSEPELASRAGHELVLTVGCGPASFEIDGLNQSAQPLEYDATDVLRVGLEKLQGGAGADLVTLEPVYLQKAIAEVRFDQRQGKI